MNEFMRLLEELEKRGIYFHMTTRDYEEMVEFTPRRPHCAPPEEPDNPRICVSPNLAGCLVAGSFGLSTYMDDIYVYATMAKARAIHSDDVFDADVTEEHWIEEPAVFVLVGTIAGKEIPEEAVKNMRQVSMPYDPEAGEEWEDEWEDESGLTDMGYHMAAKNGIEKGMHSIFRELEEKARGLLEDIVPRIEDIPGQGKFYFAEEESNKKEKMYNPNKEKEPEEEPALAEASEVPEGAVKIKSVPAPGNFNKIACKMKRKSDEE